MDGTDWRKSAYSDRVAAAMTPPKLTFGQFLRMLRESKGWTQEKLQTEADLGTGTISNLENDDTDPKTTTLEKLAKAFGMTRGDLQSQFESYGRAPEAPDNVIQMPQRRVEDRPLDPVVVALAEKLLRLPDSARHAIEGVLIAFNDLIDTDRATKD